MGWLNLLLLLFDIHCIIKFKIKYIKILVQNFDKDLSQIFKLFLYI
jgi:hypothetical protein